MYEASDSPQLHVGYGNGIGHSAAARPAHFDLAATASYTAVPASAAPPAAHLVSSAYADTIAVPATELAGELASSNGPAYTPGVYATAAAAPQRASSPWAKRALVGSLALLILAAAAVTILVTRPNSTQLASASATAGKSGLNATAQPQVDANGNIIGASVESIATTDPQGTDPAFVAPASPVLATAPPATPAPNSGPKTPPSTAPATTTTTAPTTTSTKPPTTTTSTTTAPKPNTPKITAFSTPAKVNCFNPFDPTPYFAISWNADNTTKVTISIDGPGVYKTYPGSVGSDTVPFACAGPHTYTITAYGASNTSVTKTVTITSI